MREREGRIINNAIFHLMQAEDGLKTILADERIGQIPPIDPSLASIAETLHAMRLQLVGVYETERRMTREGI